MPTPIMNVMDLRMTQFKPSTEYSTYREIMDELLRPIDGQGLEVETLVRLYESKVVYLENLRMKCFYELNSTQESFFTVRDYEIILEAHKRTKAQVKHLLLLTISQRLDRRNVS